jgi:cytochrome c-type biogenesis protein CcmH/NrfG
MFRPFARKKRYRKGLWPFINRLLYLTPQKQYFVIIMSAVVMGALAFSGILVFRQADQGDLLRRGQWLMTQEKAVLAAQLFENLVQKNPDSYEGHLALGQAYINMDEAQKASLEFDKASRLKPRNGSLVGADIAMARLLMSQNKLVEAESTLLNALKHAKEDPELLLALTDLYGRWGDQYKEQDVPDYDKAYIQYIRALKYARSEQTVRPLSEKLFESSDYLADKFLDRKEYDKAAVVLKATLRYQATPVQLMRLGEIYKRKSDLENAIFWYRKAYQSDTKKVAFILTNLLSEQAKMFQSTHQDKKAKQLLEEAKKIANQSQLSPDILYPFELINPKIRFKKEGASLVATVAYTFVYQGAVPLHGLKTRVRFQSGGKTLTELSKTVLDPAAKKVLSVASKTDVAFRQIPPIALSAVKNNAMLALIQIQYPDIDAHTWFDLKSIDIPVAPSLR